MDLHNKERRPDPPRPATGHIASMRRQIRRLLHEARNAPRRIKITVGACVLVVLIVTGALISTPSVGDLGRDSFNRSTIVYSADGEVIARYFRENRTWIQLDEVSPRVVEALIATEDRRFYDHLGIDVFRTIGAVFQTLSGEKQGGSTITMQLARNAFPDFMRDPMLIRKMKEWVTAVRIELAHDKDDILEMYLNTVPFVFSTYGIEAAALTYFDKHANELDVIEAATLVAMLKGPSSYNPVLNPERSLERRNVVLANLVEAGYLSAREMEDLREKPTRLNFRPTTTAASIAPHFAEHVRRKLETWSEESGYNIYTSGLRVHTTLDATLQRAASEAFNRSLRDLQNVVDVSWSERSIPYFSQHAGAYAGYRDRVRPFDYFWRSNPDVLNGLIRKSDRYAELLSDGVAREEALKRLRRDGALTDSLKAAASVLQGGFVAMDPRDGRVKAWVGGRDFAENEFDHVAQAKRQPGSTFKPFVYGTALANGYLPESALPDWQFTYVNRATGNSWSPGNFGGASGSLFSLRQALAYSKNTITAQLVMRLGAERVADFAHRTGIRSELEPVPSIGLGTTPVSLLELTAAYSTFANLGVHSEPLTITRIENQDGEVIAEFGPSQRQAISEEVAYGVLDMMRGVVDGGTGVRIRSQYGARGDLAGKTGTTQRAADGWFMLLHPQLIMGSWVGFDLQELTFRTTWWGQGAHTALHTAGRFYNFVDLPDATFKAPSDLSDGATLAQLLRERRRDDDVGGLVPTPAGSEWAVAGFGGEDWSDFGPGSYSADSWLNYRERKTSGVQGYLERLRRARN